MKGKDKKGKTQKTPLDSSMKWFSNVAKSLGFATQDVVREMIPSMYEFAEDNSSTYKEVIDGIRNNSMNERMIDRVMNQSSPMLKIVNTGIQNVLEDIKTGNFYNQQRDDDLTAYYDKKADAEMFSGGGGDGFDDEDFGFGSDPFADDDDDFDDDNFFIDDEDSSSGDAKPAVQPVAVVNQVNQQPNLMPVAKAISNSTMASGMATVQMIEGFASQEKTFEIQHRLRTAEFNSTLFGILGSINENLTQLVGFQSDSQSKLVVGAISFFGEQIDISKQILEKFKGDEESPEQKRDNERAKNTKTKEDIFLSEGGLDLEAYFKNVKDNIKNLDEFSDIVDMVGIFADSDEEDMMRMVTQPLKFIPQAIVKTVIPAVTQDSFKLVDQMFSSFTGALMAKLNAWGDNDEEDSPFGFVKNVIGRVLGYKQDTKTSANLGKYEKGPVPFDGVTRRTITDVIPTYLRRIESAITGTNERVYDYDKGTFTDLQDMIDNYKREEARIQMSGQSDVKIYLERALSRLKLEPEAEKSFRDDMTEYFKAMNDGQKMINPFTYFKTDLEGNEEEIDELDDNGLFIDDDNRQLFRSLLEGLDQHQVMQMIGQNVFKTVKQRNRFYEDIEADNTKYGYRYAHDKSYVADDYELDPLTGKKRRKSAFAMLDKYGKGVIDYVRDVRSILLKGINVYIAGGSTDSTTATPDERDKFFSDMDSEIAKEDRRKAEKDRQKRQREDRELRDKRSIDDVNSLSQSELQKIIDYQDDDKQRRNQNFMNSLSIPDGPFGSLRSKISDKVIELTSKPTKAINDFLYKLIFGNPEGSDEDFDSYLDMTKTKLSAFHTWAINNVYTPVKDSLIGPEGLITKIKDSKAFKAITDKKNKIIDKLLGEKDLAGNRTGGWFSSARNHTVDFFKSVKHYFTGDSYRTTDGSVVAEDDNAVFRQVKRGFKTGMDKAKKFIFGDKKTGEQGLATRLYEKFMDGADSFKRSIFGEAAIHGWSDKDKRLTMDEFANQVKERAPRALGRGLMIGVGKSILFSKAGLLGSIFMPGGIIGSIIAGTGISMLMESEKFKTWLFGEKDPNNLDRRMGGVIPQNLQDFYHDNKKTFKIGGLVGAGFGLLPSFFLPGGPLTGAILGIAGGLVTKSDAFQEFLYGPDFKTGDKKLMNGAIGKAFSKAKNWFKEQQIDPKLATFLGGVGGAAGAFGLLPSFFLPGGPIGGALLGVAAGIAASSNKFQTWLFGEEGFDGKRSGGLIDKFKTWFDIEIFDSIKITLKEWNMKISGFLYDNIAEPFLSALDPMKEIVSDTLTSIKDLFKAGWQKLNENVLGVFKDNVIKPFGESLNKYVVDPLKKLLNKSFSVLGKIVGTILAAPFKLLGLLGKRMDKKVKKGKATEEQEEYRAKYHDAKEERQRKREERRQQVQEDIEAMKEKQNKDREFFRRDGRFRNQEAKEKYERQEREKELWYQQHIAETGAETAERLEKIDSAIKDMQIVIDANPKAFETHEVKLFNELRKLQQQLSEQLQYWKDRGFVDTSYLRQEKTFEKPADPFFLLNNKSDQQKEEERVRTDQFIDETTKRVKMMNPDAKVKEKPKPVVGLEDAKKYQDPRINNVINILRTKGQSHDEGLEQVPYDGYVAELHEGEKIVPAKDVKKEEEQKVSGKDKQSWLKSIKKDVRIVADEVKGQLYGVGSNLHHIRKILQHSFGMKDDDVENLQDKNVPDYGFFGKFFHKLKNKISRPGEFLKETIMKPIDWVKEKVGNVVDKVKNAVTGIKNTLGKVINSLIEVPGKIINVTLDVASTVLKGGAKVLVKGLELGLKATATVVSDLYKGTRFLVTSIAKSFVPALVGAGKLAGKVLQGLGTAGKFAIETVVGLGKGLYTVTKDVLGFGYKLSKDVIKGVTHVGKSLFKGGLKVIKGAFNGIKTVVKGGFNLAGGALGLIKSKVTGKKKDSVQEVRVVGGTIDEVNRVWRTETVGGVRFIADVWQVDNVIGVDEIDRVNKLDALSKIVDEVNVRIKNKIDTPQQPKPSVFNNPYYSSFLNDKPIQSSKDEATEKIKNGDTSQPLDNNENNDKKEQTTTEKGKEKQEYRNQIKEQTEQTKKEKKQEEKEAEAKKDREHVSRLTSDYVQEEKRKKKEQKLDMQYKTETMKDIDSTEKTTVKQYKFWQNLLGKNGIVHTKLSSIWAWLLKVAPMALAWFKGTRIAKLLGGIFGGTGFFTALKGVLASLAPGLVALFIDNLDKSKRDERAEKYNLSDDDAYLGVGDEKRYDAETGEYILNQDRKEARNKVLKNTVRDVAKNNKIQKLGSATVNVGRNIGSLASKAFSKVSSSKPMVKVATAAGKGKDVLTKFVKLLKSATTSLISFIGNKLGNSKLGKSAAQIMAPILSKFSGTAGAKIAQKFGTKISAFIAKKGAGAATFFILDGLTAVWDLGTGQTKSETANLFAVKQDQVDAKMRTISAALKAFTNFSIIGVINLANEITSEMFGINFLRSIACAIYNFTSSGSKSNELEKNQKALEAEVAQYNQEHGTNVSKEAYLDKVNPSVFGRIMNNSWVRNFTSAFDKGDAANALGKNKDDLSLWDRVKYFGGHTANSFLNIFRSKENKRTDSEFIIGKKLVRGDNGLPVLDENGNPLYEEDIKSGKVTSNGQVLKEGADTNKTNVSELQKKYGDNAGMGDGVGNETDYQDITANFDAKATDANTWLENKSNDQNTLMRSIGAGFDTIKRVFFRWYSGDSKDTDRLVTKADDKLNLHDNRIWKNFGAFNWLTNLFQKDADKLTENSELDTISSFFDNTSQSIGAWILSKMNDAKTLLARIQAGFNSLTGSTLNIFGSDIKIESDNSNNNNKKLNFGDIVKNGIKNGINTMINANPITGAFKAIGSGIGKLFGKYEQGTPWVPDTQLALIHQGEMIVPAEHNPMNPDNQEKFDDFKYDISKDTNSVINNQLPVLQSDIDNKIVVNKETTDEESTTKKRTTGSFALDLLKAYKRITSDNLKITSVKTIDVNLKEGAVININGIENISDEIVDAIKSKIDEKFTKGKYYIDFDDEDENEDDVKDENTKQDDEKSSKSDKDKDKDKPSKTTKDTSYYDRHKDDSDYSMEDDGASYSDDSSSSSSGGSSYSGGGSSSSSGDSSSDSSYSDDSSSSSSEGSSYSGGGSSSSSGGGSSSSSGGSSSKKDDEKKDDDKKDKDKKDKDKKDKDKKDKDKKKDEDKGYKPNTLFGAIRKLDEGFKYFQSKLNVAGDGNSLNTADRLGKSDSTNAGNAIYNQIVKPFLQFNKTLSGAADGNNINTVDRNKKGSSGESVGEWFNKNIVTPFKNVGGGFKDWHETESKKNAENVETIKTEGTKIQKSVGKWFGSLFNTARQAGTNVLGGFKDWHETESEKNKENLKTLKSEAYNLYTRDDDKANILTDTILMKKDKNRKANFFSRAGYQLTKPVTHMLNWFMPEGEHLGDKSDRALTFAKGAAFQGSLINKGFVKPAQDMYQGIKNVAGGFKEWHDTENKKNAENVKVIKEETGKIKDNVGKWISNNVITPIKNVGGGFKDWHETESKKNKENLKVLKEETGKAKDNAGKWINDNIFTPIKNVGGGFKDWHETESKKNKENLNTIKDSAIGAKNKAGDWINRNIFSRISDFDKAANKQIDQVKKDATREKNDIGNWLNNKVFKRISDFDKAANKQIDQVKKDANREKNDIGNWLNDKVFSKIAGFDKNANKEIDKVKKDANREKNDIGNWLNDKVFSKISGFDKAGDKIIQNVKGGFQDWHEKDSKKNKESAKTLKSEVNKMKDSAGNWINQAKTSLLSTISKNLTDSEVSTDKQSQRDKKAKEASNRRSQESKKIHDKLTEGYNNLKESAGNWADETKNYIVDQYSKNISTPLDKSSKELQKQFAKLSKDAGNWLNSAKETVLSGWSKTTVGKATGRIVSGAKSLVNKIKSNDSSNKNLKNNTKTPDKSNQSKNNNKNNNNNKSLWDKAKDKAKEAGDWVKGKIDDAKKAASDAVNNVWKWVTGKGGSDTLPLKAQVKPKNYIFRDDEYKYKGSDKGKTDGGLRDKGNTHNFPFYSQLDQRWSSDKLIGGDSIGRAGCGPTAAAMVLTHLTGERITPDTMAKIGAENLPGYANYRYFPTIASKFKLNYSELNTSDPGQLKSVLKSGKPVILSGFDFNNSNKTPYTDEGHIVVATGVKSNQIEINDPRGPAYSGSYNASDIINGMKKAIVLEATKETREVALPSIEHLQNIYYDQDYTMSEDLPDEDINDIDSLGEAGNIKLWQKVLGYARAFKGKLNYVYGSSAIDNNGMSTDCSGFTSHVFKRAAGITLPRNSTKQGEVGTGVSSPLPADLVVWNGHVGIVADTNGNMVDAGYGKVAKERSYTTNYWRSRQNKKFRRVLKNRDEMVDPTVKNHHTKIGFNGTVDPNANGGLSSGDGGAIASLDRYLFVGDSMLGNLKPSLESDSSSVQVRFKGGKTAKYWLDNFSQMPDKSKVSNVVSWLGVNGILNANNAEQTIELMDKLSSKYGVAVNPMRVFPVGKNYKYRTANAANMNPGIKEFNVKMQEYANSKGSKFVDATNGFVDDSGYLIGSQDDLHIYGKANNDKIVQNIKTSLGVGSSGSSDGTSGEGENNIPELGVFDLLSNAMSNVIASMYNGEQVDLFNGSGSSGGGSTGVTGTGDFPKYELNDSQIKGLANIIDHEQPGPEGKYAEASIMANLTDIKGDSNATTPNLIKKAKTWFASGESRFANPGSPTSTAINAVKDVIIGGKRTLPRYVNEHDCFSDITSATNNGKSFSKTDRNQYKQHVTKIKNKYGASGTFWGFPNSKSDPFYYTSDADRSKWGENCYSVSGSSSSTDTTSTDDGAGAGYGNPYGIFDYDELAGYGPGKPEYTESDATDYDYLIKEFGPSAGGDASEDEYEYDYDLYARLKDEYGENAGSGPSNSLVSNIPATVNQYAYYCQRDTKWNKNAIGGHYVADSGCGPSSVAILATQLTGKTITPYAIAKATYPTHWGACAQWTLFDWFANKFGLSSKVIGSNNLSAIKSELKAGHPVIASTKFSRDPQFSTEKEQRKATPYTPGGHIIPFVGVDSANRLIVNDPQHYPYAHAYEDKFLAGKYYHMRQAWAYSGSAKVPSGIDVGGPYNGPRGTTTSVVDNTGAPAADGSTPTDGTSTSEETPSIPELGIFDKLSNAMSNVIASMYNGQQVDLFASSGSTDTSTSTDTGTNPDISNVSDNRKAVWTFFTGKGYSKEATAGIMGNMHTESGGTYDPSIIQSNGKGPAAGICQWENYNTKSARWKELSDYAASKGKKWDDLQSQLEFIDMELAGKSKDTYTNTLLKKKVGGYEQYKKLNDIEKAVIAFEASFERAGVKAYDKRIKYGKENFNMFANAGSGAGILAQYFRPTLNNVNIGDSAYYDQTDPKWNIASYGGNTISETGCGPTSLAMIATDLTGEEITPDMVAKAAYVDGVWGENASWNLFPWFARQLGLEYSVAEENNLGTVDNMLGLGEKVVASGILHNETDERSPFTTYGHIVPFAKKTNDGYLINDPRGKKYVGVYKPKEIVNENSTLRKAWGYKPNENIAEYLKKSNLNPELYKQKEEKNEDNVKLGAGSKQYTASELYDNAGLGSKKKSGIKIALEYGIDKLREQLKTNKDEDIDGKLSAGVSAIEYGIDKLRNNEFFNRGANAKVIDKIGKMTDKYKNVIHTYRPEKDTSKSTTDNKSKKKTTDGKLTLETFLEKLNKLTSLTSGITDKLYNGMDEDEITVEPEPEDIQTDSVTRQNKLIPGTPAPKYKVGRNNLRIPTSEIVSSSSRQNKLIPGTPAPGIEDVQEKVTKPIREIQLDTLDRLNKIVNKISENTSKIRNTSTDMTYVKECVEQLSTAVKELQSINENTKETAENISKIQVYSENYPVSQIKETSVNDKVNKLRQKQPRNQTGTIENSGSDEYKIARMIASFKK